MKRAPVIMLLIGLCFTGCSLSFHKPALPKEPASEALTDGENGWGHAVQNADIIYFPVETIGVVSNEDSTARIVQTLKNAGTPFSVAWQGIEPDNSDQATPNEPRWSYTGKLLEQCKMVMRATIDARQLFLGLPRTIRDKLQRGSVLESDEGRLIPRDYRTPVGGLEDFAEQLATVRGLQERDIENLYRAHVVAGQFAAEKIVTFMREHESEKLLVFARRRELTGDSGLPAFVSQKLKVRQITFDRDPSRRARPRLVSLGQNGRSFGL